MKNINNLTEREKRAALIEAKQVVIDFIGQALADEYNTIVGEFNRPDLAFYMNGRQYILNLTVTESGISINKAKATFVPNPVEEDIVEPGGDDVIDPDEDEVIDPDEDDDELDDGLGDE